MLFKHEPAALLGSAFGALLGILKLRFYSVFFKKIIDDAPGRKPLIAAIQSAVFFISNLILVLPMFYAALRLNENLFAGLVTGILVLPLVFFVNCITEMTGITHNKFQQ